VRRRLVNIPYVHGINTGGQHATDRLSMMTRSFSAQLNLPPSLNNIKLDQSNGFINRRRQEDNNNNHINNYYYYYKRIKSLI
jgi:hypothetical protein